MREGSE